MTHLYQDPPVGVSWLDYPTLPAVRLPDRAPRPEGPGSEEFALQFCSPLAPRG